MHWIKKKAWILKRKNLFSMVKMGIWVNELKQKLKYSIMRKILAIFIPTVGLGTLTLEPHKHINWKKCSCPGKVHKKKKSMLFQFVTTTSEDVIWGD